MPYVFKRINDDININNYLSENLTPSQIEHTKFIFNFILGNINQIRMNNAQQIGKSVYTLEDLLKISKEAYKKVNAAYQQNKFNPSNEDGKLSDKEINKIAGRELNRLYSVISNIINDLKANAIHKEDIENEKYKEENKTQNVDFIENKWSNEINAFIDKKEKETIDYLIDLKEMDTNSKIREDKIEKVENFKEECLKKINGYIDNLKSEKYQRIFSQSQIQKLFDGVLRRKKEVVEKKYNDLKKNYLESDKTGINNKNLNILEKEVFKSIRDLINDFENKLGQNDDSLKENYKKLINEEDYKKLKSEIYQKVIDKVNDMANQNEELKTTLIKIVKDKNRERNFINTIIKKNIDEEFKKIKDIYEDNYEQAVKTQKGTIISAWTGKVIGPEEKVIKYIGGENALDIRYGKVPVYSDKDSILTRYINKNFNFSKKYENRKELYEGGKPKNNFISISGNNSYKNEIEVYETKINGKTYYIDARLKQNQPLFKYYLLNKDKNFKCYNNVEEYKNNNKEE